MKPTLTPQVLLEALRLHLEPEILINRTPTALQIFAQLQLISARIISEAKRALSEQQRLVDELVDEDVPTSRWGERGALSGREAGDVKKWATRTKGADDMFAFSLMMRKQHILRLMSRPKFDPRGLTRLLDTYFPATPRNNAVGSDSEDVPHLYIQMMSKEDWGVLEVYRREIYLLYNEYKTAHATGRPFIIPATLPDTGGSDALKHTANKILQAAERIVKRAEQLEAMFSGEEVDQPGPAVKEEQVEDHSGSRIRRLSRPTDVKVKSPISSPAFASSSRAPPRSNSSEKPAIGYRLPATSTSERQYDDGSFFDHNAERKASIALPSSSSRSTQADRVPASNPHPSKPQPRRVPKPTAPAPDYTRPVPRMGENVSKAQLKPFDQKVLKRPRPSADGPRSGGATGHGGGVREDGGSKRVKSADVGNGTAVLDDEEERAGKRRVLENKAGLENSQSSGESQETKERKRLEKGKARADGRRVYRVPVLNQGE